MHLVKPALIALVVGSALAPAGFAAEGATKNVIVLITDGASLNTWRAASYYRHGGLGHEAYDDFDVQLFLSTYPLNTAKEPTGSNFGAITFESSAIWNAAPVDTIAKGTVANYPGYFAGYDYLRKDPTDSAAAVTALATGHKTYNNAINWSNTDTRLKNIGEYAVESGRALGVVTTVQWSHATPAGFLAHNRSRNDYVGIAKEAVESGLASVIMGSGHPYFDKNGKPMEPKADKAFQYVGGRDTWEKLKSGATPYKLISTKADFEALAKGTLDLAGKTKVLGTVENSDTTQFNRAGVAAGDLLPNQPDLATMTRGALEIIAMDPDGFFLMVEGGAVDWAAHANNLPRIIEEQVDFNRTVEAVVDWVGKKSSWNDTLVIVTTDHGNGMLLGPDSNKVAFSGIVNQGAGALPLVRWHTDGHTRELVPVYAKGKGADFFVSVAKKEPGLAVYDVPAAAQAYADNTDVFRASAKALGVKVD
ncbi:alkaline phosphatase [Labrys monachus]|uniref:Alkaline phosphatase n=1 Tax=Labrys monachus TaxID=217067 RepID=A0ABU0F777_9HYPH|nr:alkaline phosphatase [Labrys monachus]MDQ0390411.1 alkaline phosphatase [Labrys monachus]